jgi:hypothetical protein
VAQDMDEQWVLAHVVLSYGFHEVYKFHDQLLKKGSAL